MTRNLLPLLLLFLLAASTTRLSTAHAPGEVKFSRHFVAAESFESVGIIDVNKDGKPDLVSGDFWYANGDDRKTSFRKRKLIGDQKRFDQYYDDFSTIPLDVDADGDLDVVTGGWFGEHLRWLENTGPDGKPWPAHEIAQVGNVEATRAYDVDGDGKVEIVPNNPNKPFKYFTLDKPNTFRQVSVAPTQGHGLGFGDINGDGKGDFVMTKGWLENKGNETFELRPEFDLGTASVPVLVTDLNNDKLPDLIVGQGHSYGLHWYEQKRNGQTRTWTKHVIDEKGSQYHTLEWADIDGDKRPDLVTGKRFRAHNDNDPGCYDDLGLYYFTWDGKAFTKHTIAYGPAGVGKGTGLFLALHDLRGTGRLDIVAAGKDGLTVFFNEGR
ncbi:MAG: VCBS repeat-containing protein [Cytophagales bacterium]|nr:MAG: VCBS repeat-containing protein [Cytophagales bacterium]